MYDVSIGLSGCIICLDAHGLGINGHKYVLFTLCFLICSPLSPFPPVVQYTICSIGPRSPAAKPILSAGDKCNVQFQFTAAFTWRVAAHELGGFGSLWYPTPLQGSAISIPLWLEHKGPFISPWIILVWNGWGSKIGNVHLRPVRIFLLATQGWCHVFTDTSLGEKRVAAMERMITGRGGEP